MLPFLKPKQIAGLIISKRKPDGGTDTSHSEDNATPGLDMASEDLIRAIHAKDAKAVSAAFQAMADMCDSDEDESNEPLEDASIE